MNRLTAANIFRLIGIVVIALALPIAIFLVENETSFFKRASGEPAELIVDKAISVQVKNISHWNNISQGGSDETRMIEPVVDDLKHLQPSYIRIDHLFDRYDVVSRSSGGELVLDWSLLDITVNDILATGAKPFFSLSYMPRELAAGGGVTDNPVNWAEWENLVKRTIEHYSGIGGMNIPMVYYEIWNEPDLFGEFKVGRGKDYLDLYLHSVRGAQSAQNIQTFKIGGPATTKLYSSWFKKLISFVRDNNLWIDFYSWHLYSEDLDDYERDFEKIHKWLGEYPEYSGIELVLSETGHSSELDSRYDTNFSAIHFLALAATLEDKIDKTFTFQAKDNRGQSQYWGNWGILTHEQHGQPVKKPRYRALEFLNRMVGDPVMVEGEGSWVRAFARDDGNVLRVMVANYDPNNKHSESVPIVFNNLDGSNYTYRRVNFRGVTHERLINVQGGSWEIREIFEPNTAAIIELISEPLAFQSDFYKSYKFFGQDIGLPANIILK